MNKQVATDLGFEYTQALVRAIEAFTRDAEANNPRAFEYRGANLKYAVERSLYFFFVNNNRLYTFFTQWMRGGLPQIIELTSEMERNLALHLCGKSLKPERLQVRRPCRVHPFGLLRGMCSWTLKLLRTLRLYLNPALLQKKRKVAVLIYVIHEKFVRYLRPVTEGLPASFAYLTGMDKKLRSFFLREKIPFIDTSCLKTLSRRPPQGYLLSNFRHLTIFYDYMYESLKFLKPQCMIVTEGNAPQDEIVNQVCQQLSISVVCLQQGWSPIVHNGFRNMSYTKMLVWGEGFAELLQPYNPNQKFVVVGNHIIDFEALTTRLSKSSGRKAVCFFLQSPSRVITKESWNEFLKLVEWVASEFMEIPILVREHPSYPLVDHERGELLRFSNVRLTPPINYSLAEVLSASWLTVSIFSSTIFESIAAGVLPLIFNETSQPAFFPDVHAAGAGIEVKSLEAAKQVIRQVLTDEAFVQKFEPAMERFRAKYFYQDNHKAVDCIVEEILSLLNTESLANEISSS